MKTNVMYKLGTHEKNKAIEEHLLGKKILYIRSEERLCKIRRNSIVIGHHY